MKLASRMESITLVHEILRKLKKEYRIEDDKYFCILTSVNEAVTNAIKHGNQNDPSKKVTFDYQRSPSGALVFTITDEGQGFSWQQTGNQPVQKPDREGGRGLLIMEQFSDKRSFNKKGNSVDLYFIL